MAPIATVVSSRWLHQWVYSVLMLELLDIEDLAQKRQTGNSMECKLAWNPKTSSVGIPSEPAPCPRSG